MCHKISHPTVYYKTSKTTIKEKVKCKHFYLKSDCVKFQMNSCRHLTSADML